MFDVEGDIIDGLRNWDDFLSQGVRNAGLIHYVGILS